MKPSPAPSAAPPSVFSSDEGEKRSINPELWQACAGPLVNLPAAGTHVVYFPQGHSEQVAASMKKGVDAQITPSYPNLSSKLLCLLHNVTLHADPETDEVYAQMTLQPVPSFDKEELLRSELSLKVNNKPHTEFFCKTLTASDTSTHGGFSVPRRAAEKIFPTLDFSMQPPAQELTARDLHDNLWTFRHVFRGQPKRHLLTTGWSHFISGKRLLAGDSVLFIRDGKRDLLLGLRRANRQPPNLSISMLSSDSMHIGILAAAAHAAANSSPFSVFYNPRASPSEFVIPLAKYYRAVYSQQISAGMRFRMQFETDESETRRHMGTVTGISDLDPVRWKNSQWRNLQIGWDESTGGERRNRVSAWEIEPVISPFFICPPYFGAKHPRQPDDNPSELGNLMKRSMPWLGDDMYMKEQQPFNGFSLAQQMNMGQNQSLANSIHSNLVNPSPGFGADVSHQLVFVAPQITQHNNLQFNVPRQMQPDQLQTSSAVPANALNPDVSQIRQNLVNQTQIQMQNALQNSHQLQRSVINQSSFQQQPVFNESWHNSNQLSQVTSNQARLDLLHKLSQQSSFTNSPQMPKLQQQQQQQPRMMSDVQDHVGPQSNNPGDFMAPSNANSAKDLDPPNKEQYFGQQSYHLDYLDTSSAASASLSQGDAVHLNRNNSASFNSQSVLLRDRSRCNEAQAEPENRNIDNQPTGSVKEASNVSSGGGLIRNYENCNDAQQELSSSMVTHSYGVPDMAFNSPIDSAGLMSDSQFLNQGAWAPPPQYQRMRTYTKVYKRGAVGRSIDVTHYSGYEELKQDLARRFGIVGQLEDKGRVGWKLVYVDHENDVLLVGDDPWEEFVRCVRCIKVLSAQEVQQMSLDREQANLSMQNQACSSSDGGNM